MQPAEYTFGAGNHAIPIKKSTIHEEHDRGGTESRGVSNNRSFVSSIRDASRNLKIRSTEKERKGPSEDTIAGNAKLYCDYAQHFFFVFKKFLHGSNVIPTRSRNISGLLLCIQSFFFMTPAPPPAGVRV